MSLVSVIIPVYKLLDSQNITNFEELILSVQKAKETAKLSLEIVIINDYPAEDISQLIDEIGLKYTLKNELRLIQNSENLSQAQSRNIGAKIATGTYLHFIDQDDFISENFYSELLRNPVDLAIANVYLYQQSSGNLIEYFKQNTVKRYENALKISQLQYFLMSGITPSPGQYLIKKSVFDAQNGFPILKNKGADDYGFLFNLSSQVVSVSFSKLATYTHRLHATQGKKTLNLEDSLQEFFKYSVIGKPNKTLKVIKIIKQNSLLNYVLTRAFHVFHYRKGV